MVDTARHLRYTSRAKREADVSLSHRCTMEHHDATGVAPSAISMVLTGDRPPNKKILSKRDRDNFLTAPILWRRCPWTESAVAAGLLVEFAQ
jgi:hypothetical protein